MGPRTRLIRSGMRRPIDRNLPVNPAIERGTTLLMPEAAGMRDEDTGPVYGLSGLGTHDALRGALAELEGAHAVFLAPSGLSAITTALLAVLQAGDEVLAVDCLYGPTRRFLTRFLSRLGVGVRWFSPRATPIEAFGSATSAVRLVLLESPGSHTFELQDIAAFAAEARRRGVLTMVDNSWAAGLLFQPLAHGADLSVQALTKYAGGASDVFMGSAAVGDANLAKRLQESVDDLGTYVSPDDAYLILRGLRTLPLRLEAHGTAALIVAEWLERRPEVARVLYPPLPSSPDHALWRRDFSGGAGLLGVVLKPAHDDAVHALLDDLQLFGLGFSWGGFESLVTHETIQLQQRHTPHGVEGALIRLHIGLEDVEDLIADLAQALDRYPAR